MKKVKLFMLVGALFFSVNAMIPQEANAGDCVRTFEYKEGWKNRFLAPGCKEKPGYSCKMKTQGCPPDITIGDIDIN